MPDPWLRDGARMVMTSVLGFAVAAQFISLWALEMPYYTVLIGATVLKLADTLKAEATSPEPAQPAASCEPAELVA